ncbi:unnamed protein product, partial [Amoebophrya sp. A25]
GERARGRGRAVLPHRNSSRNGLRHFLAHLYCSFFLAADHAFGDVEVAVATGTAGEEQDVVAAWNGAVASRLDNALRQWMPRKSKLAAKLQLRDHGTIDELNLELVRSSEEKDEEKRLESLLSFCHVPLVDIGGVGVEDEGDHRQHGVSTTASSGSGLPLDFAERFSKWQPRYMRDSLQWS